MSAQSLLNHLKARGIELRAAGDRLRFHPREAVGAEDLQALRTHKVELLAILSGGASDHSWPTDLPQIMRASDVPWHDPETREERLAIALEGCGADPTTEIDLLEPCPRCGSLELWQSLAGDLRGQTPGVWRCIHCEPPSTAWRLRQQAVRLRQRISNAGRYDQ